MSTTNKIAAWLVAVGALLISGVAGATHGTGNVVPGIVDPSLPQFTNSVTVRANRGKWTISGNRDFTFENPFNLWTGTGNYKLTAEFDSGGALIGGSLSLTGKIPGLVDSRTLLVTADLISFGWDGGSTIGFNTDNIVCSPLLGKPCTTSESVIVYLDAAFGGDVNARFRNSGVAVTSVPIPAAIVLFASGLGLLGRVARRGNTV